MKKLLTITLFLASTLGFSQDQDTIVSQPWKKELLLSSTFNQLSLSNWAAGGESTLSLLSMAKITANYKQGKVEWNNELNPAYGVTKIENLPVRKSDDKLNFISQVSHTASGHWNYNFLLDFMTQFAPGYAYPDDSMKVSDFLSPATLILSPGAEYKPNENFSFIVSPFTAKYTYVNDQRLADAGAFGVEPAVFDDGGNLISRGEKLRSEYGAFTKVKYKVEFLENILFETSADFFSNYDDFGKIDVNWENLLNFKVNKYFSTTFSTHLIYDEDVDVPLFEDVNGVKTQVGVGPRTQFKQVLGVTFSLKI